VTRGRSQAIFLLAILSAATGIPLPQKDHAVRMVKFARDCQECLPNLLQQLSNKLGEETKDLGMRVGCHSGPCTAGVLRGDKIRFELFGDTVNTVSEH
jgi:class 3 adenylate cyclase